MYSEHVQNHKKQITKGFKNDLEPFRMRWSKSRFLERIKTFQPISKRFCTLIFLSSRCTARNCEPYFLVVFTIVTRNLLVVQNSELITQRSNRLVFEWCSEGPKARMVFHPVL
eukprot:gnl/MRDRNA2_/MRDRNA2_80889_c0_seq2.p1 gnl/MRDRNA2_/MRDRNA2_80889_c0~~gnl/MRDRNA2_/MRDRNA2_80889_c0_seq2.p1  ORF type:complete len:113 (+),score=2.24 gnl/MRDRNA2_/MRDRNA2_80889_c0_seq2:3-341(+)